MCICTTASGKLGRLPHIAAKGNVVAIVALDVGLLLRPCKNGCYQLVGEAFIHGIMDGEAVNDMESFDSLRIV